MVFNRGVQVAQDFERWRSKNRSIRRVERTFRQNIVQLERHLNKSLCSSVQKIVQVQQRITAVVALLIVDVCQGKGVNDVTVPGATPTLEWVAH